MSGPGCLFAPDSDASTVPAPAEEVQKVAQKRYEASKNDQAAPTTPMSSIKRSQSAGDEASKPKLSRGIQSKQILGTDTEAKPVVTPPTTKSTAVKAKAAPKQSVKEETETASGPNTPQTQAVRECLRRQSTEKLCTPGCPSPAPSTSTSTATPSSGENASGLVAQKGTPKQATKKTDQGQPPHDEDPDDSSDDDDDDEYKRLARIAKAKREAHARYMRFSRSLNSSLVQFGSFSIQPLL